MSLLVPICDSSWMIRGMRGNILYQIVRNLVTSFVFSRLPLHSLGTSLADVAAFMQEVELDFGMHPTYGEDRRGIERLRSLARQLQDQREPLDEVGEEEDATPWR